jgi:predicted nucleic acid-binding protein
MTQFIIDASVAAKWFLPPSGEPLADEALQLFAGYADGRFRLAVPDLFWAECANILWKAVRQGRCSRKTAEEAILALKIRNLPTTSSLALIEDAFSIAATFERTVHDSLYVALAIRLRANLITADERLANSLAAYLPVKWLGSVV